MTKVSILIGVTGVALIGLGYAVNAFTGLIDEMTEDKSKDKSLIKSPWIEMQELPPENSGDDAENEDFRSTSEEEESSFDDNE